MFKNASEAKAFITCFDKLIIDEGNNFLSNVNYAIAGNFLVLRTLVNNRASLSECKILAQNCHFEEQGAFTGEVSYKTLKDIGVHGSLIGHSERRHILEESNSLITKKVTALLRKKFDIVLCIGETLKENSMGMAVQVLETQLKSAFHHLNEDDINPANLIIAYEPVWAIGTGKTASNEIIIQCMKQVKSILGGMFSDAFVKKIPILYGGSVNDKNACELAKNSLLDGVLVGSASLDPNQFFGVLSAFADCL